MEGDRTSWGCYPLALPAYLEKSVRRGPSGSGRPGPYLCMERWRRMVTEETAPKRRVNWLNLVFLLGTLLVALVGTPWYLVKVGLGWPEALTFLLIWFFVGLSV